MLLFSDKMYNISKKHQMELCVDNIKDYIQKIKTHLPFKIERIISVDEIPSGFCNVNYVFRIDIDANDGEKTVYIKQARPYVKIDSKMRFSPDRICYEYKTIKIIAKIIGQEVVPRVLYFDRKNFVMVMEDLKRDGEVLAIELKNGLIKPEIGKKFGKLLGILHGKTFGKNIVIRNYKKDKEMFEFNYNFRTSGARKFDENSVERLVNESKRFKKSLIISDLASKNVFVEGDNVRLYDFEGAHFGDPAWDVGFILGHFILEVVHRPQISKDVKELIKNFMKSYRLKMLECNINPDYIEGIEERATKFMGTTILHRVAGGVKGGKRVYKKYIAEENLQKIIDVGLILLKGKYKTPEQAIIALAEGFK